MPELDYLDAPPIETEETDEERMARLFGVNRPASVAAPGDTPSSSPERAYSQPPVNTSAPVTAPALVAPPPAMTRGAGTANDVVPPVRVPRSYAMPEAPDIGGRASLYGEPRTITAGGMPPVSIGSPFGSGTVQLPPPVSQRPQWKDYAPPVKHGWGRAGQILEEMFTPIPRLAEDRARFAYRQATGDYDAGLRQQESSEQEIERLQDRARAAQNAPSTAQQLANAIASGDQEAIDRINRAEQGGRTTPQGREPRTVETGAGVFQFNEDTGRYDIPVGPPKGKGFTNPFEAFAFGSPDEKKAAQDFLDMEARTRKKNEKPGEVEQRYALYQKDPAAYREMYGDRGGAQDQAQAARMLKYFATARKETEGNFMLDDATREERLAEIDALEKPYLDAAAARPNTRQNGPVEDTVMVISPQGEKGTIPRANLQRAIKRGFKQVQ
jgi:hypothetical protein